MIPEQPLVSVLIPCYNHDKYVYQCLNSIINNSYKNVEIVVIDDGSTDKSAEIIDSWITKYGKNLSIYYKSRENRGLIKTLNELVEISAGEFICLLASDDMLTNDSISKRVNALLDNSEKYVVIGDANVINSSGELILNSAIEDLYYGKKSNYVNNSKFRYSVINEWSIPGPVMMARKKVYEIIGPYPENLLAEDLNFYLKVIAKDLIFFIDEIVAMYRVHDFNMCRSPKNSQKILSSIIKSYKNNIFEYNFKEQCMISYRILKNLYWYFRELVK